MNLADILEHVDSIFNLGWATTLCGVRQRQLHQCMG